MNIPEKVPELAALFKKVGARDPQGWASSQVNEGIPQLHRFLFLRQAWSHVLPEEAMGWVDYHIEQAEKHPGAPFSGMGAALKRAAAAANPNTTKREITNALPATATSQPKIGRAHV